MRTREGRLLGRCVLALAVFMVVASGPGWAQAPPPPHVRGRLLVKFREKVNANDAHSVLAAFQAREEDELPGTGVKVLSLPANANEKAFERAFRNRAEVEFAEVDRIVPPDGLTPNDPLYLSQWHLQRIAAPDAWAVTSGSAAITIAILDTGVDGTHPDLAAKLVPGWDIYDNSPDASDVYGHGTKVAGTAAALGDNGVGVASVCWDCLVMPVRVSAANGYASFSDIARGLTWAADHGARVANISYMVSTSSTVTSAAKYFYNHGGVVTVSAGNNGTFDASADNPYILTVGGTDENDALYSWSNTGNNIDLTAPGCVGDTTTNGGGYGSACGTSFSAPIVAGVAALVLSANPNLTPAQVTDILRKSADDLGQAGWDPVYGYGRVNAANAVQSAGGTSDTQPPSVSITSPTNAATVSGQVVVQVAASDDVGVTSVSLYVDGAQYGTDAAAPYSFAWNTAQVSNGSHTLEARASDAAGNSSAASVTVTVSNTVADTTPPAIAITSPANGASVSGTVSVTCTASDNVGVTSVRLYVDGILYGSGSATACSFAWDTTQASNGAHQLVAQASDAAGNTSTASVTVTVNNAVADTTPPMVAITSPANGAQVSGTVSVICTASDNVGVTSVRLYVDGALYGTGSATPSSFAWDTTKTSNGSHQLVAQASDAAGNTSTVSVSVAVSNAGAVGNAAADTTAPVIAITAADSAGRSGNTSVICIATDNVRVVKVALYVDGVLTSTSTTAPFTMTWKARPGTHVLVEKAYDAAGNVGSSAPVTVKR